MVVQMVCKRPAGRNFGGIRCFTLELICCSAFCFPSFVAIANVLEVSADELLVDVVNCAANGVASNLSAAIEVLPHEEKMRVLKVVAALIGR